MLKPFSEWTGPYFGSNIGSYTGTFSNPTLVDADTCALLETIFEKFQVFENMANYKGEEKYLFYFRLPKGKAEQYIGYKELIEDGYKIRNKKEYYRLFDKWYPRKWYWFTAYFFRETYDGDTYYFISLGRNDPDSQSCGRYQSTQLFDRNHLFCRVLLEDCLW